MSSSKIRAGQAFVELGTEQSLLDKGLLLAKNKLAGFAASVSKISAQARTAATGMTALGKSTMGVGGAIAGIGVAGVAGLVGITKRFADAGGAIDDMAQRTGLAAEEVSGLAYAAQMSGTDIGAVEKAIRKMQASGTGAGNGTMQDFLDLATGVAAIEDPSQRAAEAMRVFGKSGAELLPLLADGGAGIQAMMKDAESLGLVMSGTDAKAAAELGDAMDRLWNVLGAVGNTIGSALAPTLQSVATTLISAAQVVRQFIDDNREWVVLMLKVGAGVALVGGAIVAFGGIVAAAGFALGGLVTAFSVAATVVGALLSPIGLVVAAVAGLGAAIVYYTGAGSSAIEWLQAKWAELSAFVMPVIEGIKNALSQGEWGKAAEIAMLALQIAFRAGLEPLYGMWTDLQTWLISATTNAVVAVANVFAGIPTTLMNAFGTVITWLTGTWDQTVNYIAKKLLYLYSLFDSSVDYENAAKQMDTDSASRASARQQSLDAANARRNEALAKANQERLAYGEGLSSNVRSAADARKAAFSERSGSLREQMAKLLAEVNAGAVQAATESASIPTVAAKMASIPTAGMSEAAAIAAAPTAGTFSGFAAGMIGAQSPLLKLAETGKKQVELLTQIAANTRDADTDLVFE